MISRSIAARLMMPLAVSMAMLCALAGIMVYAQVTVARANQAAIDGQTQVNQLGELRSVSRALQRDALNLITETDAEAREGIVKKFDSRMGTFKSTLESFGGQVDKAVIPAGYFASQDEVAKQLEAVSARPMAAIRRARSATFTGRSAPPSAKPPRLPTN
ncbi:MAG TPA: hypothetical protein VGE65_10170 [Sphingobium sp.]